MHRQIRHLLIRLTFLFDHVNLHGRNLVVFITNSYHDIRKPNSSFGYTIIVYWSFSEISGIVPLW